MSPRCSSLRSARLLIAAALTAGVLGGIAVDQLFAAQPLPSPLARDEEFVVKLSGPASLSRVTDGGIVVTAAPDTGTTQLSGTFVAGRALIDSAHHRAVVVRPEAVREFFVLFNGLEPADAADAAERVLARAERTGDLRTINSIDKAVRPLGGGLLGGVRLDDPDVRAFYPAQVADGSFLKDYRRLVAGSDDLWQSYLTAGEIFAFVELTQNPGFERFFHPLDQRGEPSASSVLRQREHRRVLMRRSRNLFTFVPDIPTRADLTDAGFAAGGTYNVSVAKRSLRAVTKSILPGRGGALRFVRGFAQFHVADDPGDGGVFLGGLPWAGSPPADAPRVVNITPPNGEAFIDRTTDWEDPNNQFTTPLPLRNPFVIRLRFSRPLDPRTVDAAHFLLTKVAVFDSLGNQTPVNVPVSVRVTLLQRRMGEILVEMAPQTNLDPMSGFEVHVLPSVMSLDGKPLGAGFISHL